MNANEILAALAALHPDPDWVFVTEASGAGRSERIDAYAMSCWKSRKFERHAYEVKVSRGDFLRELAKPEKRRFALEVSNRFWFAAPKRLIGRQELPNGCGLIEISGGMAKIAVKALNRATPEPPLSFLLTLPRRARQMGKREATADRAPPGWPLMLGLARAAAGLDGGRGMDTVGGLLWNLAQALRLAGFHAMAREIDAVRRAGTKAEKDRLNALIEDFRRRAAQPPASDAAAGPSAS